MKEPLFILLTAELGFSAHAAATYCRLLGFENECAMPDGSTVEFDFADELYSAIARYGRRREAQGVDLERNGLFSGLPLNPSD